MKWNKEALILATPLNYITLQEPFTVLNKIHGVNVFFVKYATLLYWPVLIVVLLRGLPIKLEHPIDSRISGVKLYESVRLLSGL